MEYQIVKMQFPEEEEKEQGEEEIQFTNIVTVPLTYSRELIKVVLDAKRKRMAISSMGDGMQSSSSIQVLIVLDWAAEPVHAVNIDLEREYVGFKLSVTSPVSQFTVVLSFRYLGPGPDLLRRILLFRR